MRTYCVCILAAIVVVVIVLCIFLKFKYSAFTPNNKLLRHQRSLKILLSKLNAMCTANNLAYWLSDGTLLGAVRHHDIIPWDDDIDVQAPSATIKFLLDHKADLALQNLLITHSDHIYRLENIPKNVSKGYIDIFEMIPAIKKDKMVWVYADPYNTRRWPKVYMPYSELYPLKLYQFGNLLLPGPNNTHGYLTRVYDDYMTPKIEKGHHSL